MELDFVGPIGGNGDPGKVPTQAETLARLLGDRGHTIRLVSQHSNRYARLADIVWATLVRSQRIDVQMLQVFSGPSFVLGDVASCAAVLRRTPIVMSLRGGHLPAFAKRFPGWTRRVLRRAAVLVAPSSYLADELRWLGLPITVIRNVIDIGAYSFELRRAARPRLLWMRAFHDLYHPDMAVRVLARLVPSFRDVTLTMAGPDRGQRNQAEALALHLGVRERIHFTGFLDAPGKAQAGREHDIYLNTSRVDNMPVSVIEMAAMGLPVVSTSVGGMPYLFTHGVDGLLVPASDDEAMAEAVARLLREPALVETLSSGGRTLASSSSSESITPQWERLLNEVRRR